ncbi:Bug family tripartite tricarboxylate transporter substrate binding protein [Caldovatus aquaticus]|uniref:Tripartite tricarboxylate transporter substrate binding protein n=1 Tax=Caldovatus aquaticus TaxID=2865671 RepID=A0ABS7F7T4_9PROT|nr:tripartite tricarboxylate transporter substrate binding protein [Caldovatus aquaticus]MBW8271027.1 tripartite tricarboxylate transporter substrate binding protein [Caldovatus aquaticus]
MPPIAPTRRRAILAAAASAAAGLASPPPARAQSGEWPTRTVRAIVPWPPGGSTDILVRIYCERLQAMLGQTFVVENRPGAGGNIGIEATAKAAPDGYTLGIAAVSHLVINRYLYSRLPYDPERDFTPVALAWELPNVAVVPAEHNPSRTLREFIAWAKAKRGGITYASPGIGTTPHLSGALLAARAGYEATHVPFRGAAQAIPVMLKGEVDFALDNLASYMGVIREGKMRALAVTSAARFPMLPDVPTMAEAGVPDFVVTSWQGFVFPAGTPRPIVDKLNAALKTLAEDPAMQRRFLETGAQIAWSTPEALAERAARERPMWQEAVRISGARAD